MEVEGEGGGVELRAPHLEADLGQGLAGRGEAQGLPLQGSSPAGGGPLTLRVVSMVGKTSRMRCHSSTRRIPSRITGVTGISKEMRTFSGNSPSLNSNWPSGQRKRS